MTDQEVHHIEIKGEKITDLIDTHISWVVIGSEFVYKIKKPVSFSFVDFSSVEKRKYFCEEELRLNRRLTSGMYLDVVPIYKKGSKFFIGSKQDETIDYAVKMIKQNVNHQMHLLLEQNKISGAIIIHLAEQIADFHKNARLIRQVINANELKSTFNDIISVHQHIQSHYDKRYAEIIVQSVEFSNLFLSKFNELITERCYRNMIRDCHGDLHSGNIFIEEEPIIFDCIEFNPAFRQIDLLYELAFFCMDLDSFGRRDMSKLFIDHYLNYFPEVISTTFDSHLFIYYKLLRANIKVKVLALKEEQHLKDIADQSVNDEIKRYLRLMLWYHHMLIQSKIT